MDYENTPGGTDTGRGVAPSETGDEARLVSELAALAAAVSRSGAVPLVPGADGVVVLPQGATLDDIRVAGRDLIVQLDDGRVFIIPDGAVFVPEIVIDGVAVPPLNLAALLIGEEAIEPAAGNPRSSGGNFFDPAGPIQDAFGLGDLLPPTALAFPVQVDDEVIPQPLDRDPTAVIITVDQPVGATSATATVAESGLPASGPPTRGIGEPAGSNAAANTETTTGTILFTSPDGVSAITINGTAFTGTGQTIVSPRGTLTITSFDPAAGTIGFSYTLTDNLVGGSLADSFTVAVSDPDGDVATATLTVNVADDAPTARNDTDSVPAATFTAQTGNVITGVGTTSGATGADTLGADSATITRIASVNVPANTDTSFDAAGNLVVVGQFGTLTIRAEAATASSAPPARRAG